MKSRFDSFKSSLKKINWGRVLLLIYLPISTIALLGTFFIHIVVGFIVIMNQRRFIYHSYSPNDSRTHVYHPRDIPGLETTAFIEEAQIQVPKETDVKLHSYLLLRKEADSKTFPTMMWCQGTGGNIVTLQYPIYTCAFRDID
jgi:hypothetical protein